MRSSLSLTFKNNAKAANKDECNAVGFTQF
jgi:hypothetical protein